VGALDHGSHGGGLVTVFLRIGLSSVAGGLAMVPMLDQSGRPAAVLEVMAPVTASIVAARVLIGF
jgi:hypothetical protein